MSDLDKKYPLRLDTRIDFKNLIPHFYVSDNETSDFYIKFTNDNQPVSVENVVIAIVVVNPNGQINSSLLDVNIDKGLIYCNLPNELKNVVGVYKAKIMCISEEERLVSNTFEYKVDMDEFAILNEVVENSDEILLLTQMLSQINVISTEEGKRIENENIRLVNETERITNETNRINNEDERKSNELERIANETKRNNDENERQLKETERNENELNRESQELIRQNNELDRIAYNEVIENNENERHLKESERISNEESRANSENIRINNENNRERNEQIRQNNEEDRKFEFTMMNQSLNDLSLGVNSVKNDILNNESNRISSEEDRKSNEELRINNEDVRITNEEARVKNEDTRLKSEEIRVSNEDTRERSENARKTNENTRVSNENKRITAESTRSSNENIRVNAENKRRNDHTARMAEIDEALANLPNSLPVANQTTLGGVKVGAGLSITADGILSATGGGTANSVTWENVVGRPTKMSEFANDSGFITSIPSEYITETELTAKGYATTSQIPTVPTKTSQLTNDSGYATETYVTSKIAEASLSGGTADSTNKYDNSNKYDNPYKNKGSVVVKMETHCHTTNSDGDGTLEQVINAYKSKGFNAICITDHDMVTDTNAYNTSDFITILGAEHTVSSLGSLTAKHMNVINTNYVSEKETPFEVYQDYKSNKSFTVKNHPHDILNPNYEVSYDNGDYLCDAIEIFNGKRQIGYLYAFWRAIETGHKIKHVATDDFHEASTSITGNMTSSGNPIEIQTITGWIKLYCKEFSKQGIMDALYKGSYISCIEHDMDIESGDDYIRATTEIPSDFRFVDKNGLLLKEEKNVMTSEYTFNGFEELVMVISQPVGNPTKYAISQCIFNNDVFGKEHKQVVNDKMLCEKIITDKFIPKYHLVNNEEYTDYPFLHIKNLELYGKTVADYTNRTFKHSRAIMAFNDEVLTLSSELLKQGDYIKDGCLYKNTDEIVIDGTWNIEFYKTYTNVNQFRIEIQNNFFKPRGDCIFMSNYAPRIIEYGSSNPVVGIYLNTSSAPRYITIQLDKTEFPDVDTLKAKLNETPLRILYSTFETKVIKLPKEYYIDTLGANEINVMTEASAFSFDMIHNEDVNAPEYGLVSKLSMILVANEGNYDGTGNGISMNIDGTNYTLSQYNMYPFDYIKDNVIYKCTKSFDYNDIAVVTKLNSTNYFRVKLASDIAPIDFIDYKVVGYNGTNEIYPWIDERPSSYGTYMTIYYEDVPPYTKTNFPTLANLKALFAEKYPDFKVYLKYKDAIGTENITLPTTSITKDSIITMNDKYSSSLFKIN